MARALVCAALVVLAWSPCAFALNTALEAGQYAHTSWKIRDGHFKGVVTSMAQLPDGYLWLGTQLGMLRFDGVRFVPWQPPPNQSLPSNNILSLLAARDGTLWIGTDRGLVSWKDGQITRYDALAGSHIGRLVEDAEGAIWLSRFLNSWMLCGIQNASVTCHGEDGGAGTGALGLYVDRKGTLWVGTSKGVWRWKPGAPTFHPLPDEVNGIQGLAEDGDGALLMYLAGGIRRFVDGRTQMTHPFPSSLLPLYASELRRDRDGGLWAATSARGLVHVHEGRIDLFSRIDGLSGDGIMSIFEDREGNVWVATLDGLDRFRESAVVSYTASQGLSSSRVTSVSASHDGSVWVGTFGGLNRWKDGQARQVTVTGIPGGVQSIFEDSQSRVWASTASGVGYLDDNRLVLLTGVPGGVTRAILEDGGKTVWIGKPDTGLYRLAPGARDVEPIPWTVFTRNDFASALAADPLKEGVWVGFFRGGLSYFAGGQVRASYGAAEGLAAGRVSALYVDPDKALWVATDGGLSRLKDGRLTTLTSRNGLPCDATGWVIDDATRSLWLGMACGLVRIGRTEIDAWSAAADQRHARPHRVNVTLFDQSDGVRTFVDASFYTAPVARASNGTLWFVSQNGLSAIDPARIPVNRLEPPVRVEQITADRTAYDLTATVEQQPVRLPPLTRDLQIEYTALSFVAPEKVRFRYRLEGHDRDWLDVGARRQAFYNDLAPGTYRFRVMASNGSGVWNEAGAFVDFSVAPAYYQTAWFRAAAVAMVLALCWVAYRLRLRQMAYDFNLRLDERVNERTRIARELHDTLLQSFQGLMLRFQSARDLLPAHPAKAVEALDGALDRADQAIVEGRDAIENLRSSTAVSNELAQAIGTLAEELTHSQAGDTPAFRMSVEGSPRHLHPIVRDDIHRIAREALRNAFRHAQAGQVEAEITYGPREVRLRIRDDGKGIDEKHLGAGRARHWGLTGMRERAAQIGAQLDLWSEVGAGTEVELRIPGAVAYGTPPDRGGVFRLRRKQQDAS